MTLAVIMSWFYLMNSMKKWLFGFPIRKHSKYFMQRILRIHNQVFIYEDYDWKELLLTGGLKFLYVFELDTYLI